MVEARERKDAKARKGQIVGKRKARGKGFDTSGKQQEGKKQDVKTTNPARHT